MNPLSVVSSADYSNLQSSDTTASATCTQPAPREESAPSQLSVEDAQRLAEIEQLLNTPQEDIDWLETAEELAEKLSLDIPNPSTTLSIKWETFIGNVECLLSEEEYRIVASSILVDGRIFVVQQILKLLKRFNLDRDFKDYCRGERLSQLIPAIFLDDFQIKSQIISGWDIAPQIIEYLNHEEDSIIVKTALNNISYLKMKRKETKLPISLILQKGTTGDTYFNLYATRRLLGRGALKKVKELISITHSNAIQAKFTPRYKPQQDIPESVDKWKYASQRMLEEALIIQQLTQLTVPHIIPVYPYIDNGQAVIFSDVCDGRDLNFYLSELATEKSLDHFYRLIKDAIEALQFMHSLGVCHLDIKMANILIKSEGDEARAKLCDFGSVCRTGVETKCETTFPSPEMVCGFDTSFKFKAAPYIDLWGIGLILFSLRTGNPVTEYHIDWRYTLTSEDRAQWKDRVDQLRKDFKLVRDESSQIDSLIEGLLDDNPLKRPNTLTVLSELENHLKKNENKTQ